MTVGGRTLHPTGGVRQNFVTTLRFRPNLHQSSTSQSTSPCPTLRRTSSTRGTSAGVPGDCARYHARAARVEQDAGGILPGCGFYGWRAALERRRAMRPALEQERHGTFRGARRVQSREQGVRRREDGVISSWKMLDEKKR